MSKFVSRRAEVGVARETSRGIPVVPQHWIPFAALGINDHIDHVIEESALGVIEDSDNSFAVGKYAGGTIECDLRAAHLGLILTNLLGAAPSTGGGNPYTHTFTLTETNQHASLSLLVQDKTNPDINRMYALAMINTWTLKIKAGAIVTHSIDFMARSGRDWTAQTSSFTAMGLKFLHQHASIKVAANTAGLGAATKLAIKSLDLTVDKNVMKSDIIGTVAAEDFNNQQFTVKGTIELNYEDSTWRDYMLAQTDRAMEIKLNAGAAGIFTIQLPLVHFHSHEADRSLNDIAKQKIEFVAHRDAANGVAMISTCTLVNAVSSY